MALKPYVATSKSIGAFQNMNLWEITQMNLGGVSFPSDLLFRVKTIGLPEQSEETLSYSVNRFNFKQPSHITRDGEIELKIPESERADLANFKDALEQLKFSMSQNDATGISKGWDSIKGQMTMYLLSATGKRTQGYKLMDIWLQPSWGGEGGTDAEVKEDSIVVHYNWWSYLKA